MSYVVIPLDGNGIFDLNGVRFNGDKSFMYWKRLSTSNIESVAVIFNKEHENIEVRDKLILSLKGLVDYQDLCSAIAILLQITGIDKLGVKFHFVVGNENQRQAAESLGRQFGFSYFVQMEQIDIQRDMGGMYNDDGASLNGVSAPVNTSVNGVNSSFSHGVENTNRDDSFNKERDVILGEETQSSEMVLYIDYDDNMLITDVNGKVHGNIGVDGFGYDAENGYITKNGAFYAQDGGQRAKVIPFNPSHVSKVSKVRRKPDTGSYRSAAFVSLPVIMFVLSALLLIGSVILLFVID